MITFETFLFSNSEIIPYEAPPEPKTNIFFSLNIKNSSLVLMLHSTQLHLYSPRIHYSFLRRSIMRLYFFLRSNLDDLVDYKNLFCMVLSH